MRKKGIALITVLMVSVVLLILLISALGLTSDNLLLMSKYKERTAALYAAEAGIARAIAKLQEQPTFSGNLSESLAKTPGSFSAEVNNFSNYAIITSTGQVGPFQRIVEVTVESDANAYNALTSDGQIFLNGDVFVNGIRSLDFPQSEMGNIHTNYPFADAITGDLNLTKVNISGKASAVGTLGDIIPAGHRQEHAAPIPIKDLDKNNLINVPFDTTSIPADGVVNQNTLIEGDLTQDGNLKLSKGTVLYVKGNLTVNGSITGEGKVVCDGNITFKGVTSLELENTQGVVIYGEKEISVAHPLLNEAQDTTTLSDYDVSCYFAKMPANAAEIINQNLPSDAPRNQDFFSWYSNNLQSPSPEFNAWRNGNGSPDSGLPSNVKDWLDQSAPLTSKISDWATR